MLKSLLSLSSPVSENHPCQKKGNLLFKIKNTNFFKAKIINSLVLMGNMHI